VAKPGAWPTRRKRASNTPGYWTNVRQIFIGRRGVIGGINARIHVAIVQFALWNASTQKEDVVMPIFAD